MFVIDSMWVFAVFGCLAAAALVARQVVHRREVRRRHEEALRLTRRRRPVTDPAADADTDTETSRLGDVPTQREVAEERDPQRSRDS